MASKIKTSITFSLESLMGREFMDAKIKNNPLESTAKVVDGRIEKIVIDNSQSKWAARQSGL